MSTKLERLAQITRTRYNKLNADQQEIFDAVEEYRQMYRSFMTESDSYPWDYQLVDPQIFPLLRAYLARLNPSEARISLESRTGQDQRIKDINQSIINWELGEILLTMIFYRNMFSGFMAGKGYLKTGWKYEPAVKIKSDRGEYTMRDIVNRADLKNVRFQDMFIPDRNNPELESQPYIVERMSMRYGEMLDMNKEDEYWNSNYLKKIKSQNIFDGSIEYGVDLPDDDDLNKDETVLRSQRVKLLCMHTLDGEVFYTFEDGPDWVLNKNTDNEYWHGHYPYIDFTPFPEDDEYFSMGIVQPVADLQIAMSSVLNQLLTNARKAGNPMWISGSTAAQTPDWMFVNRPDGVIRVVGDTNQITQVKPTDTSAPLLSLRKELQSSFEQGSSMSSLYSTGVARTPQVNKTARGAEIIDANIDTNLQLLISLYGAQILKRVGEHFLELNPQYITEEQTFKITGKAGESEYLRVKPDEIGANFDVKASPERMLKQSPALRQAGLLNLFNTLGDAKKQGAPVNLEPVVEAIVDAFPDTENIDGIIIDPSVTAQEAIDNIMRGLPAEKAEYDDMHKEILTIVQKHLIDNPNVPDEQLKLFAEYITDLKGWIEAKNQSLLVGGGEGGSLPMSPQGINQSLAQRALPQPGAGLPIPLTQDQLGL